MVIKDGFLAFEDFATKLGFNSSTTHHNQNQTDILARERTLQGLHDESICGSVYENNRAVGTGGEGMNAW